MLYNPPLILRSCFVGDIEKHADVEIPASRGAKGFLRVPDFELGAASPKSCLAETWVRLFFNSYPLGFSEDQENRRHVWFSDFFQECD